MHYGKAETQQHNLVESKIQNMQDHIAFVVEVNSNTSDRKHRHIDVYTLTGQRPVLILLSDML